MGWYVLKSEQYGFPWKVSQKYYDVHKYHIFSSRLKTCLAHRNLLVSVLNPYTPCLIYVSLFFLAYMINRVQKRLCELVTYSSVIGEWFNSFDLTMCFNISSFLFHSIAYDFRSKIALSICFLVDPSNLFCAICTIATATWDYYVLMYGMQLHSPVSLLNTVGVPSGVCAIHSHCMSHVTQ